MKTNVSYEEALRRASDPLRAKIERSVEIVRKAEKLAMLYSDKGFYLAFSGGKDSQALYHITELAGVPFVAEYSVTTCDPPKLIAFIKRSYPEVSFKKPTESIYSRTITKYKGMLPTQKARWCCADFKEGNGGNMVTLMGVRKGESLRRSKRNAVETRDRKFSGEIEDFQEYRKNKFEHRSKKDTDDYMKFRCIKGKDGLMVMPIIEWTEVEVWEFLNVVMRVPHCILYDQGYPRLGCILCPLKGAAERRADAFAYPHHKHKWIEVIIKRFRMRPGDAEKYLPPDKDVFKSIFKKETVESFNGKYGEREIEAAEAFFSYWMSGKKYEEWLKSAYYEKLLSLKISKNVKIVWYVEK